ncbi:unnamed protein product [Rhizophagus irregularis]|nr:unnamed protein product [Rhizophagus irregularis]
MSDTLYINKESWAISWIYNQFTCGAQSTQRIESINKQIHDKVDRSTSLCDLVININDYVKCEEHFEKFEIERNTLPTVGLPMLHNRFFGQVDDNIKQYLTPIMLEKQRLQMNQSVCYDLNRIMNWQQLLETDIDNEEICIGLREQEQDIRQVLFKSLIKNVSQEIVLEVWHIRATGTSGIGHYVVLLNNGTHLCTCLLLMNKGLICHYFFSVATYSQSTIYHITLISVHWYLKPNINQEILLQQIPAITLYSTNNSDENLPITNSTFNYLFSIRSISCHSNSITKSNKTIYAELFGLSRKVIDSAIKADMYRDLSNMFKTFLYDIQNKFDEKQQTNEEDYLDINNPNITKHKGRPPKRLQSNVEQSSSKGKHALRNSMQIDENAEGSKGRALGALGVLGVLGVLGIRIIDCLEGAIVRIVRIVSC